MNEMQITIGDLVVYFGKVIGRVEYVGNDGWTGVKSGNRVDEYQTSLLSVAK